MQFSFNPEAKPWVPGGKDVPSVPGMQPSQKPPLGNLTAFPSINGRNVKENDAASASTPLSTRPTYKSLLTQQLREPESTGARPTQCNAMSEESCDTKCAHQSAENAVKNPAKSETEAPDLHVISKTLSVRGVKARSSDLSKHGSFRGSPVTDIRLSAEVNDRTADALKAIGPSDFRAVREIGQGAFGKVYLVQSRTTRQLYAMKVLNKQRVLQKEQVAYAMGERNVMCRLKHPYLVTLRFAFQTNHRLFLVMDYIQGGHLWTHMKQGFLAEPVAKIFVAEIVLALTHLHSLGIAHRDLKPENILMDSDNHLRLTDFGLAKRDLGPTGRAHTMVGTIDYMAPEIVKGDGHGCEVDWWSLGVLLYEMLFARLPFAPIVPKPKGKKGKDPRTTPGTDEYKAEVKKRIQHGKVTWPKGQFVNVVSASARNLIQRLLAKHPEQRLTGEAVKNHEWFKGIDWDALERRQVPSPLQSSIFAAAPSDGNPSLDPAPLEDPCPRLDGYLFECDTPKGSPPDEMLTSFAGFTYVHESELARHARNNESSLELAQAF